MKRFIFDVYLILLRLSGSMLISFSLAVLYVSCLNLVVLYGLSVLLQDWIPGMASVPGLFRSGYVIAFAIGMILFNVLIMLPLHDLPTHIRRRTSPIPVIVYTIVSLLLLLYADFSSVNF